MRGDLSKFVRRRRRDLGMIGSELAIKLQKKSPSYVSKLEQDASEPSAEDARLLIDVLGASDLDKRLYLAAFQLDAEIAEYERASVFGDERILRYKAVQSQLRELVDAASGNIHFVRLFNLPPDHLPTFSHGGRDLSGILDTFLVSYRESPHPGTSAVVVVSDAMRVSDRWKDAHIVRAPDDESRKWPGPVNAICVAGRVVVGSSGWGMTVSYDHERVEECVRFLDVIFERAPVEGEKPKRKKSK